MLNESHYRALVLNADFRPLSTWPLETYSWRKAVEDSLSGKVIVLAEYDRQVHSARLSIAIPSVVALRSYVDLNRPAPLTRAGIYARDGFRCAYCGASLAMHELTFDHVIPRSRGGAGVWENLVAACVDCNMRKGDLPLSRFEHRLRVKPYHPTRAQLNAVGAKAPLQTMEASWHDWLYWSVELEP